MLVFRRAAAGGVGVDFLAVRWVTLCGVRMVRRVGGEDCVCEGDGAVMRVVRRVRGVGGVSGGKGYGHDIMLLIVGKI